MWSLHRLRRFSCKHCPSHRRSIATQPSVRIASVHVQAPLFDQAFHSVDAMNRWRKAYRVTQSAGELSRGATETPKPPSSIGPGSPPSTGPPLTPLPLSPSGGPGHTIGSYNNQPAWQQPQPPPVQSSQYNTFGPSHTNSVSSYGFDEAQQPQPNNTNYVTSPGDQQWPGQNTSPQFHPHNTLPYYQVNQSFTDSSGQSQPQSHHSPQQLSQQFPPPQRPPQYSSQATRYGAYEPPRLPQRGHTVPGHTKLMQCGHDEWYYDP